MRSLSTGEIDRMKSTQESAMMDTCVVQTYAAGSQNAYGEYDSPTYTDGLPIACGFAWMTHVSEIEGSERVIVERVPQVRLPIGTVVDQKDRIKMTKRFGVTMATPEIFEMIGPPDEGPSGLVAMLKSVELE